MIKSYCILLPCLFCVCSRLYADTFVVTNLSDNTGPGTLRTAIVGANAHPGSDTIRFQFTGAGPYSINLTSELPEITEAVVIDGTTQPGFAGRPIVELNGAAAGAGANGLFISGGGTVLRGLVINRFDLHGVLIAGGGANLVQTCFIGSDVSGTNSLPNGQSAVAIAQSPANRIGGTASGQGNVLSGRNRVGVYIAGDAAISNCVEGNFIGTDLTGRYPLGSLSNGVLIAHAPLNTVGGTATGARNIISANRQSGIYLFGSGTVSNTVAGNFIGLDVTGSKGLGNLSDGITVQDAWNNLVGGSVPGARNVISGNGQYGIYLAGATATGNAIQGNYIGTDLTGSIALSNSFSGVGLYGVRSNNIGGIVPGTGNLISANGQHGIQIFGGSTANLVLGNYLGVNAAGDRALPNQNGLAIESAPGNRVGGPARGEANVISGNQRQGIYIDGQGAADNIVQGNLIGTDAAGATALPNRVSGVTIYQAPRTLVGGNDFGCGNLISGNGIGVFVAGTAALGTVIQGNWIGLSASGSFALPNRGEGVFLVDVPRPVIGGIDLGMGNFISGNLRDGIYMTNCPQATIQGNLIGTDVEGLSAVPNGWYGLSLDGCSSNLVGGTLPGAANLISGNGLNGLWLVGAGASRNKIQGNYIGTAADGVTPLDNAHYGLLIEENASQNTIGGIAPGEGNTIAFNSVTGFDGVRIKSGSGNAIAGNSIFGHLGLGIDLGLNGVTANDSGDADTGANNLQNFPVLSSAVNSSGQTVIQGTLNSIKSRTYRLEFFATPSANPAGYAEAKFVLGRLNLPLPDTGTSFFEYTFPAPVPAGYRIAATATDPDNNTSEFSAGRTVTGIAVTTDLQVTETLTPNPVTVGQDLTAQIVIRNNGSAPAFGVRLRVVLPPQVSLIHASPGYETRLGRHLLFNLGTLGAGWSTTVTVLMWPLAGGDLSCSATVSSAIPDSVPDNDSAAASATVVGPELEIRRESDQVVLSWPAVQGFTLQETTELGSGASWQPVLGLPVTTDGVRQLTLGADHASRFFRLAAP